MPNPGPVKPTTSDMQSPHPGALTDEPEESDFYRQHSALLRKLKNCSFCVADELNETERRVRLCLDTVKPGTFGGSWTVQNRIEEGHDWCARIGMAADALWDAVQLNSALHRPFDSEPSDTEGTLKPLTAEDISLARLAGLIPDKLTDEWMTHLYSVIADGRIVSREQGIDWSHFREYKGLEDEIPCPTAKVEWGTPLLTECDAPLLTEVLTRAIEDSEPLTPVPAADLGEYQGDLSVEDAKVLLAKCLRQTISERRAKGQYSDRVGDIASDRQTNDVGSTRHVPGLGDEEDPSVTAMPVHPALSAAIKLMTAGP